MAYQLTDKGKIFFKLFSRFLKENHCFSNYQKALAASPRSLKIIQSCNNWNSYIIDKTLVWRATKEGFDFWENLDRQFCKLCGKIC